MAKLAPTTELSGRLHSATLHLLRALAREDTASGISPARLSGLSVLVFGGPRTIGALAAAERVTPPTMTRLVAGMEADGLVTREQDTVDRRVVRVAATERGRRLLIDGRDRRLRRLAEMVGPLPKSERRTLAAAAVIIERMLAPES
jgi:DNA-binding MarR family transcriptional regulator